MWQRKSIEAVLADPTVPEGDRRLLARVGAVRRFAAELGLSVDEQYTDYVDWPGDRIVTTLVRTRAGSLEAVPWRYPILGALPYKGFFDQARAEAEAARLERDAAFEVCVSGVSAYSTLGWIDDPVTQPMLRRGPGSLVETLFHELVHATAFLPDAADFNESVAQFIGQQAALRFFEAHPPAADETPESWPDAARVAAAIEDRNRIAAATLAFRAEVEALDGTPDRAQRRAEAEATARAGLRALPLTVYDAERVAERARLSDACMALRGTYVADGPRHAAVLRALGGDLPAMIDRLRRWADEERSPESFYTAGLAGAEANEVRTRERP